MKQTVVLYGDSFFWGVNAQTKRRHLPEHRVKTVIEDQLGGDVEVIVEGLRGRTMFGENGSFPQRNGLLQFGPIIASHLPVDVLVIMLGSNDVNSTTRHSGDDVADAVDAYMSEVQLWCDFMGYDAPQLLLVAPPDINNSDLTVFAEIFDGAAERLTDICDTLIKRAADRGWESLDARTVCESIGQDGIHLDPDETRKLAIAIADKIRTTIV